MTKVIIKYNTDLDKTYDDILRGIVQKYHTNLPTELNRKPVGKGEMEPDLVGKRGARGDIGRRVF